MPGILSLGFGEATTATATGACSKASAPLSGSAPVSAARARIAAAKRASPAPGEHDEAPGLELAVVGHPGGGGQQPLDLRPVRPRRRQELRRPRAARQQELHHVWARHPRSSGIGAAGMSAADGGVKGAAVAEKPDCQPPAPGAIRLPHGPDHRHPNYRPGALSFVQGRRVRAHAPFPEPDAPMTSRDASTTRTPCSSRRPTSRCAPACRPASPTGSPAGSASASTTACARPPTAARPSCCTTARPTPTATCTSATRSTRC